MALAEELGNLVPFIGGPAFAVKLLKPLEALAAVEETVVREKAVQSLQKVCLDLPQESVCRDFIPLVLVRILPAVN